MKTDNSPLCAAIEHVVGRDRWARLAVAPYQDIKGEAHKR